MINKKYRKSAIFLIISLILSLLISKYANKSFFVIESFFINGIIIAFNIYYDKYDYSLNKMFWYFMLFFMFISPLFQYFTSYNQWNYYLSETTYYRSNNIICMFLISYILFKKYLLERSEKILEKVNKKIYKIKINKSKKISKNLLYFTIAIFLIYMINVRLGTFYRGNNEIYLINDGISAIINHFIKAFPVFCFCYIFNFYNEKDKKNILLMLFIMIFVMIYPQSTNRYLLGIVYLGLLIVIFQGKIKKRYFNIFIISLFILLFPLFQLFKWYSFGYLINNKNTIVTQFENSYNSADFDAYSMLGRTINYTDANSFTYGKQLSTTLFFFIPRKIWNNKPFPTGKVVAISQGQTFTDLSCPLMAEGYIDFGTFGVVLYSFLLSAFLNIFDMIYYKNINKKTELKLTYPFMFGAIIFILRGALQPTFMYTLLFYFAFIIVKIYCIKKGAWQR